MENSTASTKTSSKWLEVTKLLGTGFLLLLIPAAAIMVRKVTAQSAPNSPFQFLAGTFGILASVFAVLGSIAAFGVAFRTLKENRQEKG